MKHLSLCLTVIVLGGLPLAAAAFDYGPNQAMLASTAATPQLPGTQIHAVAAGEMPKPDMQEASAADPNDATNDDAPPAHSATPPGPGITRSNAAASPPHHRPQQPPSSAKPTPEAKQAAWQSLLPGSIQ